MGYYYTADLTLLLPTATINATALDRANLASQLTFQAPNRITQNGNFIQHLYWLLDCELLDQGEQKVLAADGIPISVTQYTGFVSSTKFSEDVEVTLRWLASHGADIDMTCHSEDSNRWRYHATPGGTRLHTVELTDIAEVDLLRLRHAAHSLRTLARLTADPTSADAAIRATVQAM